MTSNETDSPGATTLVCSKEGWKLREFPETDVICTVREWLLVTCTTCDLGMPTGLWGEGRERGGGRGVREGGGVRGRGES